MLHFEPSMLRFEPSMLRFEAWMLRFDALMRRGSRPQPSVLISNTPPKSERAREWRLKQFFL
jgi:hypothetical protein